MPENKKSLLELNNLYNPYNFVARAIPSALTVRKLIIIFSSFAVGISPVFTDKKGFSQVRFNYELN